jgi:hypothetical protein
MGLAENRLHARFEGGTSSALQLECIGGIVTVMSGPPIDLYDATGALYGLAGARPNWLPGATPKTVMSNIPSDCYFNPFAVPRPTISA